MRFLVPGAPKGKGRPRFVRATGRTYTPPGTAAYERTVRDSFVNGGGRRLEGPVRCQIEAVFSVPASYTKKKRIDCIEGRILPTCKPDCDNIAKAILDALNGVAFKDDSHVTDVVIRKRYGMATFVLVELEEIDG